jgi:hypothetical protein
MPMNPRLLRPTASGFNPRQISGLALWLDGADASSLYTTDAGPVTAVSSPLDISGNSCLCWYDASDAASITKDGSNLVSQWNDKSGNARHATSSGSLRPTHGGSQNGRTVMQFTGTQGLTITGNFLQLENVTMFAVAMKNIDHFSGIISSAPTNPEDSPILAFYNTTIALVNRRFVIQQAAANGVYRLICGQAIGTTQRAHFEGVQATDGVASAALNTTNTVTKIGPLRTSDSSGLNGNIAEIVCYSGNLSTTDRARVEAYLAAKWGISGVHAPATATNDPVGYWGDKSGNNRHATQATGASRPTISATALNGRRQLGLVSQHLRGPSTTWTGSASIYWVGRTGQAANAAIVFGDGTADQIDGFHAGWLNTAGVGAYGNGWGAGNAPRAESPSAWRSADIVAGVTLSSTESLARVNGATTSTTALTGTLSQATAAQFYIGRESSGTWTNLNGSLAEVLIYQPALSASQRVRLERYLAAKWGITLAPQVSNADAQDWVNRVYANGGTVSTGTANAVNSFCDAIDAAGIRDRFARLNLMAGTGLNAALVPLYRSTSFGGSLLGNATDTNVGPFVSGDYVETGASGGLTGNGSSKYLNTGLAPSVLSDTSRHLAAYVGSVSNLAFSAYLSCRTSGSTGFFKLWMVSSTTLRYHTLGPNTGPTIGDVANHAAGFYHGDNDATTGYYYRNGVESVTADTGQTPTAGATRNVLVFANNTENGVEGFSNGRLCGYSLGAYMTATQKADYYTAMQAFQTALGRNV